MEEVSRRKRNVVLSRPRQELLCVARRDDAARPASLLRIHPSVHARNVLSGDLGDPIDADFRDDRTGGFKVIRLHDQDICDYREFMSSHFANFAIEIFAAFAIIAA